MYPDQVCRVKNEQPLKWYSKAFMLRDWERYDFLIIWHSVAVCWGWLKGHNIPKIWARDWIPFTRSLIRTLPILRIQSSFLQRKLCTCFDTGPQPLCFICKTHLFRIQCYRSYKYPLHHTCCILLLAWKGKHLISKTLKGFRIFLSNLLVDWFILYYIIIIS